MYKNEMAQLGYYIKKNNLNAALGLTEFLFRVFYSEIILLKTEYSMIFGRGYIE